MLKLPIKFLKFLEKILNLGNAGKSRLKFLENADNLEIAKKWKIY